MMIPEFTIVGPGIQPASIARRRAVSAYEAAVSEVALDREAAREQRESVAGALERPIRRRIAHVHRQQRRRVQDPVAERRLAAVQRHRFHQRHGQVVVRFDQTRQDRLRGQVDYFRAGGNLDVPADRGDLPVLHQDDLIRRRRAGVGIDQASGPDCDRDAGAAEVATRCC